MEENEIRQLLLIENPDVKQEIIHCLRVFAKCALANLCARRFSHLSYLQKKERKKKIEW